MIAVAWDTGANDAVTALLVLIVAGLFRTIWAMQQRISRLEALDEYRERTLDLDREPDDGKEQP